MWLQKMGTDSLWKVYAESIKSFTCNIKSIHLVVTCSYNGDAFFSITKNQLFALHFSPSNRKCSALWKHLAAYLSLCRWLGLGYLRSVCKWSKIKTSLVQIPNKLFSESLKWQSYSAFNLHDNMVTFLTVSKPEKVLNQSSAINNVFITLDKMSHFWARTCLGDCSSLDAIAMSCKIISLIKWLQIAHVNNSTMQEVRGS